jgi:hypothetical protein
VKLVLRRGGGLAIGLLLALSLGACSRKPPTATPEGSVHELVDRFRRWRGDPADAKAVHALLSSSTRDNLAARAKRYGAASGKTIAPEAMLVPSRFVLRFEPARYVAEVAGAFARVSVVGSRPEERAEIPCVFEESEWRVELALPALAPVDVRPGLAPN